MDIEYCGACFRTYRGVGLSCPHCGFGATPTIQPRAVAPEAPASDLNTVGSALRWGRHALLLVLVAVVGLFLLDAMMDRNQAAQASWMAQSQVGGQRDARRAELRAAADALERLHEELAEVYVGGRLGGTERVAWTLRWRDQLSRVPVAYRLNAQLAVGGSNDRAEQALRNVMLYLTSLEQSYALEHDRGELASLEASFRLNLQTAREALD